MEWQFMHILCAINAKNHILVVVGTVWLLILNNLLNRKNSFVQIAVKSLFKTVKNMGNSLFNLNANFVVRLPNGFAGGILISVNLVINANVLVIM